MYHLSISQASTDVLAGIDTVEIYADENLPSSQDIDVSPLCHALPPSILRTAGQSTCSPQLGCHFPTTVLVEVRSIRVLPTPSLDASLSSPSLATNTVSEAFGTLQVRDHTQYGITQAPVYAVR